MPYVASGYWVSGYVEGDSLQVSLAVAESGSDGASALIEVQVSASLVSAEASLDATNLGLALAAQGDLVATGTLSDTAALALVLDSQGALLASETGTDSANTTAQALATCVLVSTEIGQDVCAAISYGSGIDGTSTEAVSDTVTGILTASVNVTGAAQETTLDIFQSVSYIETHLAAAETQADTGTLTADALAQATLTCTELGFDVFVAYVFSSGITGSTAEVATDTTNLLLTAAVSTTASALETGYDVFAGESKILALFAATEAQVDVALLTAALLAQLTLVANESGIDDAGISLRRGWNSELFLMVDVLDNAMSVQ